MKIWNFITKQYNTGIWFGAFQSITTNTVGLLAPFTPLIGFGTFYGVWQDKIVVIVPWLTPYVVMVIMGIGTVLAVLVAWKIIIPAKIRWANWIEAQHGNIILQHMDIQDKNIKAICLKLGIEYISTEEKGE